MFMTTNSLHTPGPSQPVLPVAMVFSTKMLLTQTASGPPEADNMSIEPETLTIRATKLTTILSGIPGYSHGGLNE